MFRVLKLECMISYVGIFFVFFVFIIYYLFVNDEEVLLLLMRESLLGVFFGFGFLYLLCLNV